MMLLRALAVTVIMLGFAAAVSAMEVDGSYTNMDGTVQIAANGKHWFGERLKVDGRYNKIEGDSDRFAYGMLSRQQYRSVVFETAGRVFDTHKSLASSAGFTFGHLTFAGGFQIEYPDDTKRTQLGTLKIRISKISWFDDLLTFESVYTYLTDQVGKDRHDLNFETRLSGKRVYTGARYSHMRQVIIHSLFVGIVW